MTYYSIFGFTTDPCIVRVLFVSILAHTFQFLFLLWVEEPHIQKIYGNDSISYDRKGREVLHTYFHRDLIVFKNFDIFRATDSVSVLIIIYSVFSGLVYGPDNLSPYIFQAVLWRLIHSYGLGLILHLQHKNGFWSRHFIKFGDGNREAFQNWKVIYNLSQTMLYVSYMLLAWKLYSLPVSWFSNGALLRHTIGIVRISVPYFAYTEQQ